MQPQQNHSYHHLTVPSRHDAKKEATQLSPVKKRVKEGTPPNENQRTHREAHNRTLQGQSASPNYWHNQQSAAQVKIECICTSRNFTDFNGSL